MNKRITKLFILVFSVFAFFTLIACSTPGPMHRFSKKEITSIKVDTKRRARKTVDRDDLSNTRFIDSYYELAKNLYPDLDSEKPNTLISPLSAYLAFGLLYNGANNASYEELAKFFGLDLDEVNKYSTNLYAYYNEVNPGIIDTANSVWINNSRNDYQIKQGYLHACEEYYNAEVYYSPFDDSTVSDINNWVYNHTDGMIEKTLDSLTEDAILYLINTVLFNAKWAGEVGQYQKFDFTNLDKSVTKGKDMICGSGNEYFENKEARGFLKRYSSENGNYAFFGILPNDFNAFYDNNIIDNIYNLFNSKVYGELSVSYRIPAFEYDYYLSIKDIMISRGFTVIFDEENADFTNMFDFDEGNVYVSTAFQKARIELSNEGTKAAAVTVIGIGKTTSVDHSDMKYYEVFLDRPFIYCIYDLDNQIPVFIGTIGNL